METTQIREEADILSRLIRLKNIDGVTNEEYQKILSTISGETILEVAKFGFYSQEASEILKERMKRWSQFELIAAAKSSDHRISVLAPDHRPSVLAYEILVKQMTQLPRTKLEKAMQERDDLIARAALEAEKRRKEIHDLREKLGLDPHH